MGEKVNPSSQEGQKSRDQKLYFYEEKCMNKAAHHARARTQTHTHIQLCKMDQLLNLRKKCETMILG